MKRLAAFLLLLTGGFSAALAQDDDGSREKDGARDPFTASERMRKNANDRFVPADALSDLPRLEMRGYVEDADGKCVAILEVDGRTSYVVRKGDTINLPLANRSLALRVVEIKNLEVRIEIGELRRVLVVR